MTSTRSADSAVDRILAATADLRDRLLQHPLYTSIRNQEELQLFMRQHVFAVYDFMWLLKRLQREICSVTVPWLPPADPELARFINEMVLAEETDEDGQGGYASHFQLYLQAMSDIGAPRDRIELFVQLLQSGTAVDAALRQVQPSACVQQFVRHSLQVAVGGTAAEVAAAFCFGREDVIPEMFQRLLQGFLRNGLHVPRLQYYIERHIELDGEHHGPLTRRLVNQLCGQSPETVAQAAAAARQAILARIQLWDGVLQQLEATRTAAIDSESGSLTSRN